MTGKERAGAPAFTSICGDRERARGTYREFMIFAPEQAYPAFICWYRRCFDFPAHEKRGAARVVFRTTWEVASGAGWSALPEEVERLYKDYLREGPLRACVRYVCGGQGAHIDFARMQQFAAGVWRDVRRLASGDWLCGACHSPNRASRRQCSACRPAAASKPDHRS